MSEYRYYEFRALDRPLTRSQMGELRARSSRARITATSFVNEYNWGDLKGDPLQWLERYFDAFLYMANWGESQLGFRIPERHIDVDAACEYCGECGLSCERSGDYLLVLFEPYSEESEPWVEAEGTLDSLAPLRADLMEGDLRSLYLGWLFSVQQGEFDDETLEPPVPPGLGSLTEPLSSLASFLHIPPDLLQVAAEASAPEPAAAPGRAGIAAWLSRLDPKDKDEMLCRLLAGDEPALLGELKRRAAREIGCADHGDGEPDLVPRRTVGQLLTRAAAVARERRAREDEERARAKAEREREQAEARQMRLDSLVGQEKELWDAVESLIALRTPSAYGEAISRLQDLRALADMAGQGASFVSQANALARRHARKATLIKRLHECGLDSAGAEVGAP